MTDLILYSWAACSLFSAYSVHQIIKEESVGDSLFELYTDKANLIMFVASTAFPLLTFAVIVAVGAIERYKSKSRLKAREIICKWNNAEAHDGQAYTFVVDPITGKFLSEEDQYMILRENVRKVSTEDLKFLVGLPEGIMKVDKNIIDTIMHELCERELLK